MKQHFSHYHENIVIDSDILGVLDSNLRGSFVHHYVYFLPRLHLFLLFTTLQGAICTKWSLLTLFVDFVLNPKSLCCEMSRGSKVHTQSSLDLVEANNQGRPLLNNHCSYLSAKRQKPHSVIPF